MVLKSNVQDIGVVIPWGKVKGNIHRCVESALCQTARPSHLLIVANGEITQLELSSLGATYKEQGVKVLFLPGCENANVARNVGATHLPCAHIAYLDSDDWWEPSHLEWSVKELIDNNADLVYSGMKVHRDEYTIQEHYAEDFRHYKNMETYLLHYLPAQTSSYVVRRGALLESLWNCSLRRHQDYDFISRMAQSYVVKHIPVITTNVDWSYRRKHKLHRDCFEVLYQWRRRVPFELYKKHFLNLFVSAVRSNDFVWLTKVLGLADILIKRESQS